MQYFCRYFFATTVFLLSLLVAPQLAAACSCAYPTPEPFISKGLLPANTKGALFLNHFRGPLLLNHDRTFAVMQYAPKPFEASDFTIIETESKKTLPAKITYIDIPAELWREPIQAARYFVFNDPKKAACVPYHSGPGDASKLCLDVADRVQLLKEEGLKTLLEDGTLREVTKEYRARYGLLRVEAKNGLAAGATYSLSTSFEEIQAYGKPAQVKATTEISLDPTVEIAKADLTFEPRLVSRQVKALSVPAGASCSETSAQDTLLYDFGVNPTLKPFAKAIQQFSVLKVFENWQQGVWQYASSLCSFGEFARSGHEAGKELFHISCEMIEELASTGEKQQGEFTFYLGFLEVHDELEKSSPVSFVVEDKRAECKKVELEIEKARKNDLMYM